MKLPLKNYYLSLQFYRGRKGRDTVLKLLTHAPRGKGGLSRGNFGDSYLLGSALAECPVLTVLDKEFLADMFKAYLKRHKEEWEK